ncbi:phosphatase [Photobacterium jeanii]|uniref:protein-tyrosine-phosphatase n=1 Tax=Photobacterium jeanii TaxID=858640 RepID=A0A178KLY8_9GAMM|nr:dual specificity protein phosphatase family protein [Photobacterium jeanii]OAN18146.1 phosphatase [Photobacterium jeanii]PST92178.1 phosphatase [Photobacterium jeanii]
MATHPFWTLPLEGAGSLLLTPCPGTKEADLASSIEQLKAAGATVVLTALESDELPENGVQALAKACEDAGLTWFHLPIEDDCAPAEGFEANWAAANAAAQAALNNGDNVVAHCKGGSGRTGLIAARIMLERGVAVDTLVPAIQALRPGAFTRQAHIDYIATFK